MELKYSELAENAEQAVKHWDNSQYDLSDMVLCLTYHALKDGLVIYEIFKTEGFMELSSMFMFNFKKAKNFLGIAGDYVDRTDDYTKREFNPKRHPEVLIYPYEELKKRGHELYEDITKETNYLAKQVIKKNKNNSQDDGNDEN